MNTKVKICGITRTEDAELAIELGADYVGFIFVKESPRCVAHAPRTSGVQRVGVFRNAAIDEVRRIAEREQLDLVQLHGEERYTLDGIPTIKAINVDGALPQIETEADYVLFDTGGGTGRTFDWSLLESYPRTKPFFLAGGITPNNVSDAIARTNPYAIDVASGVERSPGVKDHDKLRKLFERIQR
ncbi:MAG TPA: phosphoribosylanthranilate isomerase [Thermoanaerobaculia bacterium]|nr:phosphoribosylanthranilate isomerase [Thermoanaerobaculia bacterium]